MTNPDFPLLPDSLPRRRFVQGLMVAGILGGLPLALKSVSAQAGNVQPAVLSGTEFILDHL